MHKSLSLVVAMMLFAAVGIASTPPASSALPSWSIVPSASPGMGPPNGKFKHDSQGDGGPRDDQYR